MEKKWIHFVYVILFWILGVPALFIIIPMIIFIMLPGNLGLAVLPIIALIGLFGMIVYLLGAIYNIFYVISFKKKYVLELSVHKKLSTVFFVLALLAPFILLGIYFTSSYVIRSKMNQNDEIDRKQMWEEEAEYVSRLDEKYEDYRKRVEGEHVIVNVRKQRVEKGNDIMIVTLDNGETFTIVYNLSDWTQKNKLPLAVADGKEFAKRDDVLGKKFTFTFYDRSTFEAIYRDENNYITQILVPVEARSGDY